MAFKEYRFKDVEYNESVENCTVIVEIEDDELGIIEHTMILGSKHFAGKGHSVTNRNKLIKDLVKAEVGFIHGRATAKGQAKKEAKEHVKKKVTGFAKGTNL